MGWINLELHKSCRFGTSIIDAIIVSQARLHTHGGEESGQIPIQLSFRKVSRSWLSANTIKEGVMGVCAAACNETRGYTTYVWRHVHLHYSISIKTNQHAEKFSAFYKRKLYRHMTRRFPRKVWGLACENRAITIDSYATITLNQKNGFA